MRLGASERLTAGKEEVNTFSPGIPRGQAVRLLNWSLTAITTGCFLELTTLKPHREECHE